MKIFTLVLLLLTYVQVACAGMKLETEYPYHLEKKGIETVFEESTVPLYVNIVNFGNDAPVETEVKITLPEGFKPVVDNKWQAKTIGDKTIVTTKWILPQDYGQTYCGSAPHHQISAQPRRCCYSLLSHGQTQRTS